jgi:hypothetical protein
MGFFVKKFVAEGKEWVGRGWSAALREKKKMGLA